MEHSESEAQAYAWNWFALHSAQRLQLVNFWLVSVAFLVTGFVQARSNHLNTVALGISVAGALSSLAFMQLDVRTRRLVQVAEEALRQFEIGRGPEGSIAPFDLLHAAHRNRPRLHSYRVIIQGLQLSIALLFCLAAIDSVFS